MINNPLSVQLSSPPPQYPQAIPAQSTNISARQKIHVSNLPLNVTAHQLQQAFQSYGNIIDIRIIRKTPTGLPLHISCYAFIAFADNESADKAIKDGGFGEWTVKPQIDKQSNPSSNNNNTNINNRQRSRSRSRSQERHTQRQVLTNGQIIFLEQTPKIQIQLFVRELFVNGIPKNNDETRIRQIFNQYGPIERVDQYPNKHNILNSYIKFFTIDSAILAYQNSENISQQFSTPIKIYYSDPIKRHNIVGNNLQNEQQSKLSSVLFIFFPPNQNKKVDHAFLFEICQNHQCRPLLWNYYQQDPNYKSYTLLQFKDSQQALQMRSFFQQHTADILGDSKCEVGIVSLPTQQQQQINQQQQQQSQQQQQVQQQQYSQIQMIPYPNKQMMIHQQQPQIQQVYFPPQQLQQYPNPQFIPPNQPYLYQPKPEPKVSQKYDSNIFNYPQQPFFPQEQQKIKQQNNIQNYQQIEYRDTLLNLTQQLSRSDMNIFWSGFMFRSKSHRVGVDAKCIESDPPFQMSPQIQVNYKGNFSEAKKCANEAFKFILCPSDSTQNEAFQKYIDYFQEKKKVGVAQVGSGILYLLPPNENTNSILQISGLELLALYSEEKKKSMNIGFDNQL